MKNAVDDLCDPHDFVVAGSDQRLCDRGLHSYSPGSCYSCGADQDHSRTPSRIAILRHAPTEVFINERLSRSVSRITFPQTMEDEKSVETLRGSFFGQVEGED
jgi:hypothetical protein